MYVVHIANIDSPSYVVWLFLQSVSFQKVSVVKFYRVQDSWNSLIMHSPYGGVGWVYETICGMCCCAAYSLMYRRCAEVSHTCLWSTAPEHVRQSPTSTWVINGIHVGNNGYITDMLFWLQKLLYTGKMWPYLGKPTTLHTIEVSMMYMCITVYFIWARTPHGLINYARELATQVRGGKRARAKVRGKGQPRVRARSPE